MGHLIGNEYLQDSIIEVAKKIVLALKKAPTITGKTKIEAEILWGDDLIPMLDVLEPVAKVSTYTNWDYKTMKKCLDKGESPIVIGIGGKADRSNLNWNCGACGYATCKEFNSYAKNEAGSGQLGGPSCNWKVMDWAIACDWACASAGQYKVDNRIMGSLGFAMQALEYLPNSSHKLGIALGPARDMVYYSREEMHGEFTYEDDKKEMIQAVPNMFGCFGGSGNPNYKAKDDWWAPLDNMEVGFSESAMDKYQEVVYEQVPEAVIKHCDQIAAKYKKKK
jgi:uncharacterized ferredoxin-like protein